MSAQASRITRRVLAHRQPDDRRASLGPQGGDYYGVVAEAVAAMTIAGTPLPMNPGIGNDDFFVGISDDFRVTEI